MRISDWSSDVCSSDLRTASIAPGGFLPGLGRPFCPEISEPRGSWRRHNPQAAREQRQPLGGSGRLPEKPEHILAHRRNGRDRQSVVKGKCVSGRVDSGGRRHNKKKTNKHKKNN